MSNVSLLTHMLKRLASILLLLAIGAPSFAGDARPSGTNCDLKSPPTTAGEEMNHGVTLKVFPRARDIAFGYTGCQLMWATTQDQVVLISVSAVEQGHVTRLWSPSEQTKEMTDCRYREGKLVRGGEDCPAPEFLLVKSMPAGCVERSKAAGRLAEGCAYE